MATDNNGGVKTLAIRLENDIHLQLTLIAQLKNSTITEEIRQALAAHVAQAKANGDLVAQAEAALAEIEREAAERRNVLSSSSPVPPMTASHAPPDAAAKTRKDHRPRRNPWNGGKNEAHQLPRLAATRAPLTTFTTTNPP